MSPRRPTPLLALCLMLGAGSPLAAQVEAFRVDTARVPVGRLYEYRKSNRDGSRPAHVSLYVAGPSRLESLKWTAGDSAASLVVATLDWSRLSVRRFESWKLSRAESPALRVTLDTDPSNRGVRVSFLPDSLLPIHRWPWHSYDFDYASLSIALAHLRAPERPFTFERADIVYAEGGPPFADLGEVRVRYERRERRADRDTRRYALSGPGLGDSSGTLWADVAGGHIVEFEFPFPDEPGYRDGRLVLQEVRTLGAEAWEAYKRERIGAPAVFRIAPLRPVDALRVEALAAAPPVESGPFRAAELTELVALDATIRLDIRYATPDNFLGTPVYTQARAFLQRPAAQALVRAHRALAREGYGLLIHDAYRPWYVTRIFWDATPPALRSFVADPARGSRHNRGSAVDLTLYDLRTGAAVVMPSLYDEFSPRAYPDYAGGTAEQRRLRDLLRAAMEREGFGVASNEWWHFDHRDWKAYGIQNVPFESLAP